MRLHHHANPGPRALLDRPVDGHVLLDHLHQFVGDEGQLLVAHDLDRALIFGQGIVEGQFFFVQTQGLAALARPRASLGPWRSVPAITSAVVEGAQSHSA